MSCEELKERLYALLDGELEPAEEKELQAQLEARPECQELLRSIRALQEALPTWETPPPSSNFVYQVRQKIEATLSSSSGAAAPAPRSPFGEVLRSVFRGRLSIPVPLGTAALALLVFSALLNLRFLTRPEGEGPGAGRDNITPVNRESGPDVDGADRDPNASVFDGSGTVENPVLVLDEPASKPAEAPAKKPGKDGKKRD